MGRYLLHAYICDGGSCVREVGDMGTSSFASVFQRLPDGCRYAVVSQLKLGSDEKVYALLDLWETKTTGAPLAEKLLIPKPLLVTDSLDVAIMRGSLLYGEAA